MTKLKRRASESEQGRWYAREDLGTVSSQEIPYLSERPARDRIPQRTAPPKPISLDWYSFPPPAIPANLITPAWKMTTAVVKNADISAVLLIAIGADRSYSAVYSIEFRPSVSGPVCAEQVFRSPPRCSKAAAVAKTIS